MEIQELGPAFRFGEPTVPLRQRKPSFIYQPSIVPSHYPQRKPFPNLHKVKKFTNKLQPLQPYTPFPLTKKNLNFNYVYNLTPKKITEAEIVLDYIDGVHIFYSLMNSFKKLRNVNKLSLKVNSFWRLNLVAVKKLVQSLSLLKNLKEINLYLPYHSRYQEKEFIKLWKPLKRNKQVQIMYVTVHISFGIKGSIIDGLHTIMNKMGNLSKVDLSFQLSENNYKYKPVKYEKNYLEKVAQKGEEKISFKLDIPFLLERRELLNVLNRIYCFKNLRALVLDFTSYAERVDGEIICYLLNILSHINSVVLLEFSFELCWFLDETYIVNLARAVCRLKSIKALKLNFGACFEITDRSLYNISTYLPQLTELEFLSLNYHSCYQISDASVTQLFQSLKKINSLKQLDLNFSNCYRLTSDVAQELGFLKSLTALSVSFEGCAKMNEAVMTILGKSLSLYESLEALNLNLSYISNATNYDICLFGSAIAGLKKLKHLTLDFVGFANLTDTAFINFFRKIGTLKDLTYLGLNLRYVSKISDKAISVLSTVLGGLTKLEGLRIDLLGAASLTEGCYPKLVRLFAKLENSKAVSILI